MEHLTEFAAGLLETLTNEERIQFIRQQKWIGYPKARKVLEKLNVIRDYPRSDRSTGMLLYGESNNGKTRILKHFLAQNPPKLSENNELEIPVLYVHAPAEPNEKAFYGEILDAMCAPSRPTEKTEVKFNRVMHLLEKASIRVLIIDEINNIIVGSANKQRIFLNVIKYLSNKLQVPIVCAGTREALNSISTDEQLSNRLPPLCLEEWEDNDDYYNLLATFESILPLRNPSGLSDEGIATAILRMSSGLIGEMNTILQYAAVYAIQNGSEKITLRSLADIDYTPPTERKKKLRQS